MKTLAVFLAVFFCAEFASAQTIVGKVVAKSWRTRNDGATRDVQVNTSNKTLWHRLPEDVARKLETGEVCVFSRKEFVSCISKEGVVTPAKIQPYLEKLFVGQDEEKKGGQTKNSKKTP